MSLFKAREFWTSGGGAAYELDSKNLFTANIDNNPQSLDKVIVGSYNGVIRIYNPARTGAKDSQDTLLEQNLNISILQILVGKFVSGVDSRHIAALQSRKLSIYSLSGQQGLADHGNQYRLSAVYEHQLHRTAANMTSGCFGKSQNREFICVQSMDGALSFYEQETFSFSRFIPDFLLPGPLIYFPVTDSFLTVSSTYILASYQYQLLAVAQDQDKNAQESPSKIVSGKRVVSEWSMILGEEAVDIQIAAFPTAPVSIVVLGDKSLFCVTPEGTLKFMKKFDFVPMCFWPYMAVKEGKIGTIVCSQSKNIMIYEDTNLKWMAQLDSLPVACKVANFDGLRGCIVVADDNGKVQALYLGTDPSLGVIPRAEAREMNRHDFVNKLTSLKNKIADFTTDLVPSEITDEDLKIECEVPSTIDVVSQARDVEINDDANVPSVTVNLKLKSKAGASNITIVISCKEPLVATRTVFKLQSAGSFTNPASISVSFFMKYGYAASDLTVHVSGNYVAVGDVSKVVKVSFVLPLILVAKPCAAIKMAQFKLTVDTNKPPVELNTLFPEVYLKGESMVGPAAGQAIGFRMLGSPARVTILASKSSNRYRLQCDHFEAMWLVLRELLLRLHAYFNKVRQSGLVITYQGGLQLDELFCLIEDHLELRKNQIELEKILGQRTGQYRAIQKRLLTKFKDKTPGPLQNLDLLLDGTYRQILDAADVFEVNARNLVHASCKLSCGVNIILLLLKLLSNLNDTQFEVLKLCIPSDVFEYEEYGWEELVLCTVTHLLRTCLAKGVKDASASMPLMEMPKDATKLRKHLTILCDRVVKGGVLHLDGMKTVTTETFGPSLLQEEVEIAGTFEELSVGQKDPSKYRKQYTGSSSELEGPLQMSGDRNGESYDPGLDGLPAINTSPRYVEGRMKLSDLSEVPDLDEIGSLLGSSERP